MTAPRKSPYPNDWSRSVGTRLRAARDAKGLSQPQLGEIIGTEKATISLYELGRSMPSLAAFRLICEALGQSADFILFGVDQSRYDADVKTLADKLQRLPEADRKVLFWAFGEGHAAHGATPKERI